MAAAGTVPRLAALTWIARGHELAALSRAPARRPPGGGVAGEAEIGEALFNAPELLGGQAARAGISCATCHANGRVNRHFQLNGVSAAPGTADVSSSFFSLARANGRFDPKPIPDLALPGRISRDPASGDLERFLRGLIVEEFDGREPGAAVLGALAAYVRSIRACDGDSGSGEVARTVEEPIGLVRASVLGAAGMAGRHEAAAAFLLLSGARHQLGLIDERYRGPDLRGERRLLLDASQRLRMLAGGQAPNPARLRQWLGWFDGEVTPRLRARASRSLYERERLAAWLGETGR